MGLKKQVSTFILSQDGCHFLFGVYAYIWSSSVTICGQKYILDDPQVLWKCLQIKFHVQFDG